MNTINNNNVKSYKNIPEPFLNTIFQSLTLNVFNNTTDPEQYTNIT